MSSFEIKPDESKDSRWIDGSGPAQVVPSIPFKPSYYQADILKAIGEKPITELPYWPRRLGSRSGVPFVSIDIGQKGGDYSTVIRGMPDGKGGFSIILVDEYGTWPNYKWWRNPIRWYKWQKVMKILDKQTKKNY